LTTSVLTSTVLTGAGLMSGDTTLLLVDSTSLLSETELTVVVELELELEPLLTTDVPTVSFVFLLLTFSFIFLAASKNL